MCIDSADPNPNPDPNSNPDPDPDHKQVQTEGAMIPKSLSGFKEVSIRVSIRAFLASRR